MDVDGWSDTRRCRHLPMIYDGEIISLRKLLTAYREDVVVCVIRSYSQLGVYRASIYVYNRIVIEILSVRHRN